MLKFSSENAKTKRLRLIPSLQRYLASKRKVYSLDLLAGWSCPGAKDCLAKVSMYNGKRQLKDGPNTQFRCFAASLEVVYPPVYNSHKHNFDIVRSMRGWKQCRDIILASMPKNLGILRWHVSGDFFKLAYFQAAIEIADMFPDRLFYAYTKSLPFLQRFDALDLSRGLLRPNFLVTASRGGKYDHLIEPLGIREAKVIFKKRDAGKLPIDHDDSHAATSGGSFNLLLHGVQPAGTPASKALVQLRGEGSYNRG